MLWSSSVVATVQSFTMFLHFVLWGCFVLNTREVSVATGLPMEAVNVLQDNGLWKYAATLAAHALRRDEQTAALERWATHIHKVTVTSQQASTHLLAPTRVLLRVATTLHRVLAKSSHSQTLKLLTHL